MFSNRKKFVPEIEPKLLDYERELWERVFPLENNKNYQLSSIGKYSIIFPVYSEKIAEIIKSYFPDRTDITVTDATANMGGVSMILAKYFKVNAVEIIQLHCDILKNNIDNYLKDIEKKEYKIYCNDYLDVMMDLKQDVIFFDPPFGGTNYKEHRDLDLYLDNINIADIVVKLMEKQCAELVVVRLPINYRFHSLVKHFHKTSTYTFYKNDRPYFFLIVLKLKYFKKN